MSAADLEAQAKPNVFDAITELPALQGSTGVSYNTGSTTTGLIGLSALGLRGLSPAAHPGPVDSQRVVGGNFNGAVDVSQMPQMLIQRVDVVTGGASASWGSDAVAGVVNFVTDKKFEGFKANVHGRPVDLWRHGQHDCSRPRPAPASAGGRGHFRSRCANITTTTACCRVIRLPSSTPRSRQHRRPHLGAPVGHALLRRRRPAPAPPGRSAAHQLLQHRASSTQTSPPMA